MTDEELIARLDHWIEQQVLVLVDSDLLPIRARIEALTKERDQHWDGFVHWRKEADDRSEQRDAARQDAKEAEAYAEELENEAVLRKAAYEWVSSLLLSVQQDCIKERQHAERLEAKLAKAVATERARIVKLLDGIDRTELDDNGWWETSFGAKFGEGILNAILKGESHE